MVVAVNFGAQAGAQVAPVPDKPIARARKVDIAPFVGYIHLYYLVLHSNTLDAALCFLFIMKLV